MTLRKFTFLTALVLVSCVLGSCRETSKSTIGSAATPIPLVARGVTAAEAKAAFDSPAALTKLLEQRWPVAAIQAYCIPERRHNNRFQNLVAYSPRWEGTLHQNSSTGFDKIAWYASTEKGRADEFSLGVHRGKDYWLLEIGSEKSITQAPDFSPDPNALRFVGHK